MKLRYGNTIAVFGGHRLYVYLKENDQKIQYHIENEPENYILNVNEERYVNFLVGEFTIDVPSIDLNGVFATGKGSSTQSAVYHLPYTGSTDLLQYSTGAGLVWTTNMFIEEQCICFEVAERTSEQIKQTAKHVISNLKTKLEDINQEVNAYNTQLRNSIERLFKARKQTFLDKNNMLASLDVPIKKRNNLPETYAVPTPKIRKSVTIKPSVMESSYKPEPALDESTYHDILQTIHDVGKVFERLPPTYSGKKEEHLRDHILLYLEPRFEGSATGETFNGTGKTDILIRHENSNVFIAKCKFWEGQKQYLETITQLLGYLTWRDSKSAVVVFVRNKDFSSVLQTIEEVTPSHSNYLGFVDKTDESWFNYRFHINGDPNREVKLAVLLFHIPPP